MLLLQTQRNTLSSNCMVLLPLSSPLALEEIQCYQHQLINTANLTRKRWRPGQKKRFFSIYVSDLWRVKGKKRLWFDVMHLFILYKDFHTKIICLPLHLYYLLLVKHDLSCAIQSKKNLKESHAAPHEVISQQSSNDHLQLYVSQWAN